MDGVSTAIIVAIFVFSIFSSTGNNNYTQPKGSTETPETIKSYNLPQAPNPDYSEEYGSKAYKEINAYVARYRSAEQSQQISSSIVKYSKQYNVNPKIVTALMARESRFNPRATSSSGAMGLGQLLPSTAKSLGISDGYDIEENAKGTVRYMKYLFDRFQGKSNRVALAIGGYLQGPNAIAEMGLAKPHTRAYVKDILEIYNKI
ncbi:MAG: lytic transglycosylase domain-containing protein [bacterium]